MKKIFSSLIVLFPILSVYASPISGLPFADLMMLILFPLFTFKIFKEKWKLNLPLIFLILFCGYLFFSFLFLLMFNGNVGIFSTLRYSLYLILLIYSFKLFDFKYGIKILKWLTLFISTLVIFQFVYFMTVGATLPWRIPFFRIMDENFILKESSEFFIEYYRPTGVFLEPTHFTQYVIVYFLYLLFNNEAKKNIIQLSLIFIAIIVSGSSLGILFLIFIGMVWLIKKIVFNFSPLKLIGAFLLLSILTLLFNQVTYFNKIFSRLFTDEGFNGAAVGYRFDSISYFLDNNQSLVTWLIGNGRGTEEIYFTGIFYFLFSNGLIGLIIYISLMIISSLYYQGFKRWLILTALFLSIGSEYMVNFGILFYLCFVYNDYKIPKYIRSE